MSVFIIAEAGVNHNGSKERAYKLVDAAVSAGADAVKFQTFKADKLVTKNARKAEYQKNTSSLGESQYDMLKDLELPYDIHKELLVYCNKKKIQFMSTAFDHESLDFLVNELNIDILKIPSGDITNGPLLLEHAKSGKKIILSTGMSTLGEIENALAVIAFGYIGKGEPSVKQFRKNYASVESKNILKEKVTLLHCTTEYPASLTDINLRAMDTVSAAFGLNVGYSDHSEGITVPIVAVARGATLIEKHFTLDKTLPGPDHKASLEPSELKEMVSNIRDVEVILGHGDKWPTEIELSNREIARKSIVAAKQIEKNETFSLDNITVKRPGNGINPMKFWSTLGTKAKKTYTEDELV